MGEEQSVLSTWQVIRWWELRRLLYNALLLVIGIGAIVGFELLMEKAIPPGEDAEEPMGIALGVVAYGFMANVCYTAGWVSELISRKADPLLARKRGQKMFRAGLVFSCVLTTAPFWFACLFYIFHLNHAH